MIAILFYHADDGYLIAIRNYEYTCRRYIYIKYFRVTLQVGIRYVVTVRSSCGLWVLRKN